MRRGNRERVWKTDNQKCDHRQKEALGSDTASWIQGACAEHGAGGRDGSGTSRTLGVSLGNSDLTLWVVGSHGRVSGVEQGGLICILESTLAGTQGMHWVLRLSWGEIMVPRATVVAGGVE